MSNFRGQVQGFAVGAAVVSALMLGLPAIVAPTSPHEDMDELAATFGVEIVWTSASPCVHIDPGAIGCYLMLTPSRIYISPNLDPTRTRDIVLHEIGHVVQGRLRLPLNECAADNFAQSLESSFGSYCAPH